MVHLSYRAFILVTRVRQVLRRLLIIYTHVGRSQRSLLQVRSQDSNMCDRFSSQGHSTLSTPVTSARRPFTVHSSRRFSFFVRAFTTIRRDNTSHFQAVRVRMSHVLKGLMVPQVVRSYINSNQYVSSQRRLNRIFPSSVMGGRTILNMSVRRVLLFKVDVDRLTRLHVSGLPLFFRNARYNQRWAFRPWYYSFFRDRYNPFVRG